MSHLRTFGCDAPPNSLMDLTVSSKMQTSKGKGVGVHSLACNILGVKRCVEAPKWD